MWFLYSEVNLNGQELLGISVNQKSILLIATLPAFQPFPYLLEKHSLWNILKHFFGGGGGHFKASLQRRTVLFKTQYIKNLKSMYVKTKQNKNK